MYKYFNCQTDSNQLLPKYVSTEGCDMHTTLSQLQEATLTLYLQPIVQGFN